MSNPFRCIFAAGVLISILAAGPLVPQTAYGQIKAIHMPERPIRGRAVNLFVRWEPSSVFEGLYVELPSGWSLDSAMVLGRAYDRLSLAIERRPGGAYHVLAPTADIEASEIVLSVRVGDGHPVEEVEVAPLERVRRAYLPRTIYRETRRVQSRSPDDRAVNRVLRFEDDESAPVILRRDAVPELQLRAPFRLSAWMRTTAFAEVVLSTWNGNDLEPYPVELVVDRSGRLRAFHGRPGEHQSLISHEPVADGAWHQVTLVNEPEAGWMRLQIDGITVDSIYDPAPPPIRMGLPLAIGGRIPGRAIYFDGMRPFTGDLDELSMSAPGSAGLTLDFQEDMEADLLARESGSPRYESAGSLGRPAIEDFRAEQAPGGVFLTWSADRERSGSFEVARSLDGRRFQTIATLQASPDGRYEVFDDQLAGGVAYYRIRQIASSGATRASSTVKVGFGLEQPSPAVLLGNYPNPFKGSTMITYEVHENVDVQIGIWDLSGQQIETLVDRIHPPGVYQVRFEANELPNGTYFVRLRTSGEIRSHKIILTQ